jgi:hypothetical protein
MKKVKITAIFLMDCGIRVSDSIEVDVRDKAKLTEVQRKIVDIQLAVKQVFVGTSPSGYIEFGTTIVRTGNCSSVSFFEGPGSNDEKVPDSLGDDD